MINVVRVSDPVPVDTVVAVGVPVGAPVETIVAAVDGLKQAITDRVTFCGGWPSLVSNVIFKVLPSGKGSTGNPVTVLPLVEVIRLTTVVPSGEMISTMTTMTLVFVLGTVTWVTIGVTPGANFTRMDAGSVGVKSTPSLPGVRSSPVGEPTAPVKTGLRMFCGSVMPKFVHSSVNYDSVNRRRRACEYEGILRSACRS